MDEYRWDFGDGGKSSDISPTYTYENLDGEIIINLLVKLNCKWAKHKDTIRLGMSVPVEGLAVSEIYPNPSTGSFTLKGEAKVMSIYTLDGKEVSFTLKGSKYSVDIDVSGVLILTLREGDTLYYHRLIVE